MAAHIGAVGASTMTNVALDLTRVPTSPEMLGLVSTDAIRRFSAAPICTIEQQVHILFAVGSTSDSQGEQLANVEPSPRVRDHFQSIFNDRCCFTPVRERDFRRWAKQLPLTRRRNVVGSSQVDAVAEVENLLQAACQRRASDIHLVPRQSESQVLYRIDGRLLPMHFFDNRQSALMINRLKVLGGLDIAEQRQPQDGRFSFDANQSRYEVRVATIPSRHGEKVTLRLLRQNAGAPSFSELGLTPEQSNAFQRQLLSPTGLVLLTGPTGSGKSTTLYSAISQLIRAKGGNVITIEDPIEYEIESATQIQVNHDEKLTFPNALRSILRHDPDTILIGEIRDAETAQLAVQAALTGHLVLSTLHTNSAGGAFTRLCELGVEPFLVEETLRMVVAQRLVRRLCLNCRQQDGLEAKGWKPHGCYYCSGEGSLGRIGLFETLQYTKASATTTDFRHGTGNDSATTSESNNVATIGSKAHKLSWTECARYHIAQGSTWQTEVQAALGELSDA